MSLPYKLPPDSEPIIVSRGCPRFAIAIGALCLILILLAIIKIQGV